MSSFQTTTPTTPSTCFQQQPQRSKKKRKSTKTTGRKCRRESVLKPSVYQKIQRKRQSQTIITNNQRLNKIHIETDKRLSLNPIAVHLANCALFDAEDSEDDDDDDDDEKRDNINDINLIQRSRSHARNCRHIHTPDIDVERTPCLASNSLSHSFPHSNSHHMHHHYRRCVFLSLPALYECWRTVPASVLLDAIFMLPLHREWVVLPSQREHHPYTELLRDEHFLTLLRWKDKQGLMVYVLHEMDTHRDRSTLQYRLQRQQQQQMESDSVAPFWHNVSRRLQSMFDPATGDAYRPLILNERWWKYAYSHETHSHSLYYSKYKVSADAVLNELRFVTLTVQAMQEILYQSNPSLRVLSASYVADDVDGLQMEQTPSMAMSIDSMDSISRSNQTQKHDIPMSNTNSNSTSMLRLSPTNVSSSRVSQSLQLEAIKSILSEHPRAQQQEEEQEQQRRRTLSQLDEEEDIEVVNMSMCLDNSHVCSQLGSILTCGTLALMSPSHSPSHSDSQSHSHKSDVLNVYSDDDDADDRASRSGTGGSGCTFDDEDEDDDDDEDEIEQHLIKYRLSESTSMMNSHDELEGSPSTSLVPSPHKMFAELHFDDSEQFNMQCKHNTDDDEDDDDNMTPATISGANDVGVVQCCRRLSAKKSQTDTCTRSPSNSSSREPSLNSQATQSDGEHVSVSDDMEWWICPEYFYETKKGNTGFDIDYDD
eukprot:CAMPEP_0202687172 /NCGR_PEP_ID=MMETSP1385-20130828/2875_1 /ASSEMBLY_ACC=CAM_ASM_000861 /TAXON_ID=933848 /ORGANISM="Elphidium margaritaceum" /LENGTH=708 /DNA_ID=CAMNT_0049341915 /DNA_START=21 /DNA_END=2147 /DNA_ORIENTATION=-